MKSSSARGGLRRRVGTPLCDEVGLQTWQEIDCVAGDNEISSAVQVFRSWADCLRARVFGATRSRSVHLYPLSSRFHIGCLHQGHADRGIAPHLTNMSHLSGTLRGTPKRPGPVHAESSPSNIPRPKLENTLGHTHQSEMSGISTMSASRQKQSKRDEVCKVAIHPPDNANSLPRLSAERWKQI